jgi:hypothetical protein
VGGREGDDHPNGERRVPRASVRIVRGSLMGEQLGERAQFPKVAVASDLLVLQRFSRVERVTGIEPALSAWEEFLSNRISLSCKDIGGLS